MRVSWRFWRPQHIDQTAPDGRPPTLNFGRGVDADELAIDRPIAILPALTRLV